MSVIDTPLALAQRCAARMDSLFAEGKGDTARYWDLHDTLIILAETHPEVAEWAQAAGVLPS